MSYCYDVQRRVWYDLIRPLVAAKDERLAFRFEELMEEMHSANHLVPSRDGTFKGDGINKDPMVTKAARELEDYAKAIQRETVADLALRLAKEQKDADRPGI